MGPQALAMPSCKYLLYATQGNQGTGDMKVAVVTLVLAVLAMTVLLLEYIGSLGEGLKP